MIAMLVKESLEKKNETYKKLIKINDSYAKLRGQEAYIHTWLD
jgi:hypothetical protein